MKTIVTLCTINPSIMLNFPGVMCARLFPYDEGIQAVEHDAMDVLRVDLISIVEVREASYEDISTVGCYECDWAPRMPNPPR